MAQIKYWNGEAAVVRVFFAPGVLSPEAISKMLPRFETRIFEKNESFLVNAFVRKVVKHHDYYALLAIESGTLEIAMNFASAIERKQRSLAKQLRTSIHRAIRTI